MSTSTLTLTEFLLARIAEDEARARAVDTSPDTRGIYQRGEGADGGWPWVTYTPAAAEFYVMRVLRAGEDGMPKDKQDGPATDLLRSLTPERVLAECEAKRRIVGEWQRWTDEATDWRERYRLTGQVDMLDTAQRYDGMAKAVEKYALSHLLAIYADHPDFREGWS